ncbi:MAG: SDR family NAD(P)-dependent oxidoreductase [Pyramidobacter sp.]
MNRVWFITGAGRGFGRAFAAEAVRRGDSVIAGIRHISSDDPFFRQERVFPVRVDVTKPEEIHEAVEKGTARFGRIDVLVNNAGYGLTGAFEETSEDELRQLMETDYFGTAAVVREVLPLMRARKSGIILNMSSQGGLMGFSGSSAYCSAKFAVVGLSLVLRAEAAPFGIQVAAVCPGSFRTDFREAASMRTASKSLSAYDGTAVRKAGQFLKNNRHNQSGDPARAAAFLYEMTERGELPARILIGGTCCEQVREDLKKQLADIESYEKYASQTDFTDSESLNAGSGFARGFTV